MKFRLTAASIATALTIFGFIYFLPNDITHVENKLIAIGLRLDTAIESICASLILMCVFYLGETDESWQYRKRFTNLCSGPLTALSMYLSISLRHHIKRDGTLEKLENRVSILTVLQNWCTRLVNEVSNVTNSESFPVTWMNTMKWLFSETLSSLRWLRRWCSARWWSRACGWPPPPRPPRWLSHYTVRCGLV